MRRLLLTLAALLSTPLLLATLYLWPRSHRTADSYAHTTTANHVHYISSNAGAVHVGQIDRTNLGLAATPSSDVAHTPLQPGATWHDPYANFTTRIEWSAGGFAVISGQAPAVLQLPINVTTNLNATFTNSTTLVLPGGNTTISPAGNGGTLTLTGSGGL